MLSSVSSMKASSSDAGLRRELVKDDGKRPPSSPIAVSSVPRTDSEPSSSRTARHPRRSSAALSFAASRASGRERSVCELWARSCFGRDLGDQTALADDDDVVGGERHLAHEVARNENRSPFASEALQEVSHPTNTIGVEAVDRFIEEKYLRIAEQRCGDAEPLTHAQGELAGPLAGDRGEPNDVE